MPIGKKIYSQMSKRAGERQKRMEEFAKKNGADIPPTVHQVSKNKVTHSQSNNVHIVDLVQNRKVSPNEGLPAVNGVSGPDLVKKAVRPVGSRVEEVDASQAAIKPSDLKGTSRKTKVKKCSVCRSPEHTKRTCPNK